MTIDMHRQSRRFHPASRAYFFGCNDTTDKPCSVEARSATNGHRILHVQYATCQKTCTLRACEHTVASCSGIVRFERIIHLPQGVHGNAFSRRSLISLRRQQPMSRLHMANVACNSVVYTSCLLTRTRWSSPHPGGRVPASDTLGVRIGLEAVGSMPQCTSMIRL